MSSTYHVYWRHMNKHTSLLFAVTKAGAVVSRRFSAHGLSFADFMIMHYLADAPEGKLRRVDLAEKMGLTPPASRALFCRSKRSASLSRLDDDSDARAPFFGAHQGREKPLKRRDRHPRRTRRRNFRACFGKKYYSGHGTSFEHKVRKNGEAREAHRRWDDFRLRTAAATVPVVVACWRRAVG